jgi:hypothetical protein
VVDDEVIPAQDFTSGVTMLAGCGAESLRRGPSASSQFKIRELFMHWLSAAKRTGTVTGVAGAIVIALNFGFVIYGFYLYLIS